jgi:tetratricopeptide (TPR) repeat protein
MPRLLFLVIRSAGRPLSGLLLAAVFAAPAAAEEFQVGQRVAVIRDGVTIAAGSEAVDTLDRGEILTVANANGAWVLVRRGHSGWIAKRELIGLDAALDYFNKAVAQNPRDAGARAARAAIRIDGRAWDAAMADANEAARLNPQLVRAWLVRSAAARGQKKFALAQQDAERAVRLDSTLPDGFVAAGDALLDQGQIGRAIAAYTRALARDPANARIRLRRGQARLASAQAAQYREAEVDFEAAIEGAAYDPVCEREARLARGEAFTKQGQFEQAAAVYNEMIEKNPYDIRALIGRGTAYGLERTYILAVPDLDMAVWLNPQISMGYLARAEFRLRLGKIDGSLGALHDVDDALRLEPDNAVAYRIRGEALVKQQKWDGAVAAFDKALALSPNTAAIYRARALAYEGNADAAAAAADRLRATELDAAADELLVAGEDENSTARRPEQASPAGRK